VLLVAQPGFHGHALGAPVAQPQHGRRFAARLHGIGGCNQRFAGCGRHTAFRKQSGHQPPRPVRHRDIDLHLAGERIDGGTDARDAPGEPLFLVRGQAELDRRPGAQRTHRVSRDRADELHPGRIDNRHQRRAGCDDVPVVRRPRADHAGDRRAHDRFLQLPARARHAGDGFRQRGLCCRDALHRCFDVAPRDQRLGRERLRPFGVSPGRIERTLSGADALLCRVQRDVLRRRLDPAEHLPAAHRLAFLNPEVPDGSADLRTCGRLALRPQLTRHRRTGADPLAPDDDHRLGIHHRSGRRRIDLRISARRLCPGTISRSRQRSAGGQQRHR
jgi:hypothetical protein